MLVLQRQEGDTIICRIVDIEALKNGDQIEIDIAEIRGNRVKVGIDGPKAFRFLRGEIADHSDIGSGGDKLPL